MYRLLGFGFSLAWRLKLVLLSAAAGAAVATGLHLRRDAHSWGKLPGDAERALPGDDLVAAPEVVETRSLIIAAPPSRVWPWIAQLGYGRGGWYGFAALDRAWRPEGGGPSRSANEILPEHQDLSVGDVVPTHPSGGFVAKVVEPQRALVLYIDDAMVKEQAASAATSRGRPGEHDDDVDEMPPFRVSWAFMLFPEDGGNTRLIERLRLDIDLKDAQRRGLPMAGLGLFALLRSQMEGIKRRAEGPAGG
jgi:hypothetical protein